MEAPSLERIKELQSASIIDVSHPVRGTQPLAILNVSNSSDEVRIGNIKINIARDVLRFADLPRHLSRNEPIAIVGGGPSVAKHLKQIKKFKQIWACGSAHDFLRENGIIPTFAAACDAKEDQLMHFNRPHKKTSFMLASQVTPKLFDRLKDHKVAMWHFTGQVPEENFNGEESLGWGCMITVISIILAFNMGFQEMHFFGLDCCLEDDKTHAYDVEKSERDWIRESAGKVYVGMLQKEYISTMALMLQCDEFLRLFASDIGRYLKGYVHGGGMLAEVIKQSPPEMKKWLEAA